ncbi:MAG: peptidylprolyl isomerase [Desulfovibrionaceae bacterium]
MNLFSPLRAFVCLLFLLCAGGCVQEDYPAGAIATVNGSPIALSTLQAVQDTRTVSLGTSHRPSVETLKRQYGAALSVLIINTLVMQELERLELSVPDDEVEKNEALVRADYPENEFEKTLTEEYIDIQIWRQLLRQQLSISTFQAKVLRPQLSVKLEEIEAYYQKNKAEFVVPASLTLIQVSGTSKELVEAARAQAPKLQQGALPERTVQRFTIRRQSVPQEWQKDVAALAVGKSTPVKNRDGFFQFVCLVAQHPAKTLSLRDAYPLINAILLEDKLDASFNQWLEHAVQNAKIRVASPLLRELGEKPQEKKPEQAPPPPASPSQS